MATRAGRSNTGSSATGPTVYRAQRLLPYLWEAHQSLSGLIDQRTSVNRHQCSVLRDQFMNGIRDAETCCARGVGHQEIRRLTDLLNQTNQYVYDSREQNWTSALYQSAGFEQFVFGIANELDVVLQGLSRYLGNSPLSTIALITPAREKDRTHVTHFLERIDQASPVPGDVTRAYQNHDVNQLDSFVGQVFDRQTNILSTSPEPQGNDFQNAQKLTSLIMNVTKKKPDPKILLGRGFVGPWQPLQITSRYDLFLARYVTEETVVVKVLRNKINDRDRNTQLTRFQKYVEVWASLRSDFTLPFHGIGMSERDGQSQIYSVSPYLRNGDAVAYHESRSIPATESLQIALDAAFGLRYLHEKRPAIVHSGVRTDNILIDDTGRGVLAGFRLTEEVDTVNPETGMTNDAYRFSPPEYFADKPPPRKTSADVWSWAMVALHLVGGKKPFPDSNDFQAAQFILNGSRPSRGDYPRILEISDPDAFWKILEDCWAQDEAERPNMDEVVIGIKRLIKRNEVFKPVPTYPGNEMSVDEQPVDGRVQPPVRQGRSPPRGGR